MKLILCRECTDVVRLITEKSRSCLCGKSGGQYAPDGLNAVFFGPCIPLGFENASLIKALMNQPESGLGYRFEAFVIPKECGTFTEKIQTDPSDHVCLQ